MFEEIILLFLGRLASFMILSKFHSWIDQKKLNYFFFGLYLNEFDFDSSFVLIVLN